MESQIMKFICSNGGSISCDDLLYNLCFGVPADVQAIISNEEKFASYVLEGEKKVVARTNMKLCRAKDCQGCSNLHMCRNYLFTGTCQFSRTRRGCIFSHQLGSDYNLRILREHELECLDRSEVCTLVLQSDPTQLPPICFDYNNTDKTCKDGDDCKRLHYCEKYLKGNCMCFRNHDFYAQQPLKSLQERKIPDLLISNLKSVYFNKMVLRISDNRKNRGNRGNKGNHQQDALPSLMAGGPFTTFMNSDYLPKKSQGPKTNSGGVSVRDKTDICMYFIKGSCKHGERCFKAHEKVPYRWEVRQGGQWVHMADNEKIEESFCDPKCTYSNTVPYVHFDTLTCGADKARRLSTLSSVQEPTFVLTTEWIWYWEDEFGKWNEYASSTGGHKGADMDSTQLEQKFLNNNKDVVEFSTGAQSYSLSFQDMIQTNKRYSTKRLVRRRPAFVSSADVHTKKIRKPQPQSSFMTLPTHWDKTQIPEKGHKLVSLQRSSTEYEEIESLFLNTMRGFDIIKIQRIQNKALWEIFQWQKDQMKKNSGRNVAEKKLFHGTDSAHVDAICHNNFDWRICGVHGTLYGNGSYFASNAKYSHSYTGDSDVRSMFVSRVLVGDFTTGSPAYRRPPSKDGGDKFFYDSCVDDVLNPSIFVVFEKHQIYPEFLLKYKEKGLQASWSGHFQPPTPVPAPKPVPASTLVATLTPVRAPRPVPAPTIVSAPKPVAAPRPVAAPTVVPAPRPTVVPSRLVTNHPLSYPQPVYRTPSITSTKKKDCVIC
ncbi:protein mono-ADP-ribosyltransferase PARP12 [Genypterus blacodes]|uniref:protein mono-ADP-ribosyltransferase PARP12 n=1 Tax=Genypterus blacodes TaxID=154954 RepID=UPI003F76A096